MYLTMWVFLIITTTRQSDVPAGRHVSMDPLTGGPAYLAGRVAGAVAVVYLAYKGYRRVRGGTDAEDGEA